MRPTLARQAAKKAELIKPRTPPAPNTAFLPSGRLSQSQLRRLVDLHHSASSFITPSSLPQIVSSVFGQTIVRGADIRSFRDAAARQAMRGGIPGEQEVTLVPLSAEGRGQSMRRIQDIIDEKLLGFASPSAPTRAPNAVTLYRMNNRSKTLSWSDWDQDSESPLDAPYGHNKSSSGLGGNARTEFIPSQHGEKLVVMKEKIREDALYGTVAGSRPGLDSVVAFAEQQQQQEQKPASQEQQQQQPQKKATDSQAML